MTKITGIYEITLPNIPISTNEIPNQRPIIINKNKERIKIYPPGEKGKRAWKRIQGKHLQVEGNVSQRNVQNADRFYILIEKDGCDINETENEYEALDTEVETLAFRIMRLLRKQLPKTPIALPNQLQYKSLCKCDSESQKNTLWSRVSTDKIVIYRSSQYYLNLEKWSSFRKALKKAKIRSYGRIFFMMRWLHWKRMI